MIQVYDPTNTSFDKNGDVIILPISGSVHQVAGGNYDLTMVVPIDPEGHWAHLVPEAIVRAPVPDEIIETAYSGLEADLYRTTSSAALRSGPSEPESITYPAWSASSGYSVGSRVTYSGHNYQCNHWEAESGQTQVPPPNNPWWTRIADQTSGSPVLVNLASGKDLYYVSGPSSGWYKMMTTYGLEGYIKSSQVTYVKHLTPEETKPREISTQLFRVKSVTVETREMRVTVNAQHVSYDLNGILIRELTLTRQSVAFSLARIEDALLIPYPGSFATNLTDTTNTSYTAEISGKSGMWCILDPDNGIVPCFGAAFRRDNWDLFIMQQTNEDRGFRIRYGNNMQGINWKVSSENLITRVMPVAKAENGNNLYLDGTIWVNSPNISNFPRIRMERIKVAGQVGKDDGSGTGTTWTTETLRAEMAKQANARFTIDKVDQLAHEITVDFAMLGNTVEYEWLHDLQKVLLYDTVVAIDERVGMGASVIVTELEYDIVKKKITALKLENVRAYRVKNVSGFNVLNNSIDGDKLTDDAGDELIDQARDEAVTEAVANSRAYTQQYTQSYTSSAINTYNSELMLYLDQYYVKK